MQGNILGQNNSNSNSNLGINGIIEEYTVASGGNVNAGDFVSFVNEYGFIQQAEKSVTFTGNTRPIKQLLAIELSDNKIFIFFRNDYYYCYGVVALIDSNNIINLGTSVEIYSNSDELCDLIKLSDNKIFISYIIGKSNVHDSLLYGQVVLINEDNSLDVRFVYCYKFRKFTKK